VSIERRESRGLRRFFGARPSYGSSCQSGIDCPISPLQIPKKYPMGNSLPAETTLWDRCIRLLQAELPEQQFNTWIRPLQAVEDGRRLKLLAPNRFVVDWLQQHYIERILEIEITPLLADGTELDGGAVVVGTSDNNFVGWRVVTTPSA
jgi:hypothetical protein